MECIKCNLCIKHNETVCSWDDSQIVKVEVGGNENEPDGLMEMNIGDVFYHGNELHTVIGNEIEILTGNENENELGFENENGNETESYHGNELSKQEGIIYECDNPRIRPQTTNLKNENKQS